MDIGSVALLVSAGVASGLAGSIAGLASLFSYPALLAVGLPPVAANVTNTVALFSNTVGTAAGSRTELRGQRDRLLRLCAIAALGGAVGAALLLGTPSSAFEAVVPWLIALSSVLILVRDPLRRLMASRARSVAHHTARPSLPLASAVLLVGLYGGYFGAASGVLMLAVLSLSATEPLPVTNAVKNVATGAANIVAAIAYVAVAPVNWAAAVSLGLGALLGSSLGPLVVRRLPETPLRIAIALGGLGLAISLWR
ncbi:sulfite exporter TauE/SafE family protein [Streptomyces samsunensis]|uniref:Probable membrane transporter protein n=1 Tax=Streptomyces malaysiensis TaxID=92644 RepID=A0ABX6WAE8_STRMQ|nr:MULTISPECIES: sulfite exporter TauE/SafE family protein [Streptomyces]MCC4318638.1 sulfite exporter TauE/SafE family protein [Streptomyces malaysiensis]NUH40890.1 sulfite exporter TauE/SafE family protein [Streptomyces samsunensis]QPI57590.1 sulfite exporter TauE/SafE family protein [Streptomyces solisilvae]UHH19153.1 sulfite exporter TauE/SafE family protein [Streptomyces sp. HNM0561]WPB91970.1 sulfite exporter TauE/SafE family protein [Streptomyces malaysiensis]